MMSTKAASRLHHSRNNRLIWLGAGLVLTAFLMSAIEWSSTSATDPNIGAGLLFILGIAVMISGAPKGWSGRYK